MLINNSDRDWENFGKSDPYYGVVSHENYKKENLNEEEIKTFFITGQDHVADVIENIKKIDDEFEIVNALDFGCGVGRLLIPLANKSSRAIGIDISASMLKECRKNCERFVVDNVLLYNSIDEIKASEKINFIHSFIVFQHIPLRQGYSIFEKLVDLLEKGGVGVLHFTYGRVNDSTLGKVSQILNNHIPLGWIFLNALKGRRLFAPRMQMNHYDINKITRFLQKSGVDCVRHILTNHDGVLGTSIYFKK
jgi:2-polyprenyl-3-methyl-5-hydroxy-6-metoxy-1,4-benzoquinol methylase